MSGVSVKVFLVFLLVTLWRILKVMVMRPVSSPSSSTSSANTGASSAIFFFFGFSLSHCWNSSSRRFSSVLTIFDTSAWARSSAGFRLKSPSGLYLSSGSFRRGHCATPLGLVKRSIFGFDIKVLVGERKENALSQQVGLGGEGTVRRACWWRPARARR